MLVQPRRGRDRLTAQHDHALAAGRMAAAWRTGPDPARGAPLDTVLVVATALHDVMWREEDALPDVDAATGAPVDFTRMPAERKRAFTEPALRALEGLEPDVARLVRLHHETLGTDTPPPPSLAWLRFFDRLSLFACLTPPGSLEEARPPWLADRQEAPDGRTLRLAWEGEARLRVAPWPFAGERLVLAIPWRDLPSGPWRSREELLDAWRDAAEGRTDLVLVP